MGQGNALQWSAVERARREPRAHTLHDFVPVAIDLLTRLGEVLNTRVLPTSSHCSMTPLSKLVESHEGTQEKNVAHHIFLDNESLHTARPRALVRKRYIRAEAKLFKVHMSLLYTASMAARNLLYTQGPMISSLHGADLINAAVVVHRGKHKARCRYTDVAEPLHEQCVTSRQGPRTARIATCNSTLSHIQNGMQRKIFFTRFNLDIVLGLVRGGNKMEGQTDSLVDSTTCSWNIDALSYFSLCST